VAGGQTTAVTSGGNSGNGNGNGNGGNGNTGGNQGSNPTTTSTAAQQANTGASPTSSSKPAATTGASSIAGSNTASGSSGSSASQSIAVGSGAGETLTGTNSSPGTNGVGAANPTQSGSSPSSSPSTSTALSPGAIAGIAVGGVAALALLAVLLFCLRRRRQAAQRDAAADGSTSMAQSAGYGVEPFVIPAAMASSHSRSASLDQSEGLPSAMGEKRRQGLQHQRDLQEQMRRLQQEIDSLSDPGASRSASPTRASAEVGGLMQRLRAAEDQIAIMQAQRQSSWSLGFTDEPPPGYGQDTSSSTAASTAPLQSQSNINLHGSFRANH
jgi:hypothetical protein